MLEQVTVLVGLENSHGWRWTFYTAQRSPRPQALVLHPLLRGQVFQP